MSSRFPFTRDAKFQFDSYLNYLLGKNNKTNRKRTAFNVTERYTLEFHTQT